MEENIVELTRFAYTPQGTFGHLKVGDFQCFTVERPWYNNIARESCIPEGEYELILGRYNKGGYDAYELKGVPGRKLIKIHKGNTMDDLLGCIAPGTDLGYVNDKWAVTNSQKAYYGFMEAMGRDEHAIIRINHYIPI